ncbi:bifunctional pyr operon transcriptional regulator/uracil phosphoribosyltransferase PyrR [Desulfohalovibrio reitneri]|uniref:bifunctional pyr operon transcriptional regulator/uracil phosphoribosyltransferase PyrR n=1 Tax=Desulfohalovibrio reitneri TaxID=1307759 RepID=UPI0004A70653|nr:bifunctional pyr operon transcriptional regulator/uracil phosphoribosyltransferase PyrR [Desulfohalovibrio reitneri]
MEADRVIASGEEMEGMIQRLAEEIASGHGDLTELALVGIQRRGADLADRLKTMLDGRGNVRVPLGKLDINLYRDDWTSLSVQPFIQCTEIPFDLPSYRIILVDDVLFTGRTIRAALEAVLDYGRPKKVELLALVDRGHRELPIQPDFVGTTVETGLDDRVNVLVRERDGEDSIKVVRA